VRRRAPINDPADVVKNSVASARRHQDRPAFALPACAALMLLLLLLPTPDQTIR
jgi:hypothetical protein